MKLWIRDFSLAWMESYQNIVARPKTAEDAEKVAEVERWIEKIGIVLFAAAKSHNVSTDELKHLQEERGCPVWEKRAVKRHTHRKGIHKWQRIVLNNLTVQLQKARLELVVSLKYIRKKNKKGLLIEHEGIHPDIFKKRLKRGSRCMHRIDCAQRWEADPYAPCNYVAPIWTKFKGSDLGILLQQEPIPVLPMGFPTHRFRAKRGAGYLVPRNRRLSIGPFNGTHLKTILNRMYSIPQIPLVRLGACLMLFLYGHTRLDHKGDIATYVCHKRHCAEAPSSANENFRGNHMDWMHNRTGGSSPDEEDCNGLCCREVRRELMVW